MAFKSKEDRRAYDRGWYRRRKHKRDAINKRWEDRNVAWFAEFKSKLKCALCPETAICCLQFHHLDPKQKDIAVAVAARCYGRKRLMEEIAKCVVLCANCHAKYHAGLVQLGEQDTRNVQTGVRPSHSAPLFEYAGLAQ